MSYAHLHRGLEHGVKGPGSLAEPGSIERAFQFSVQRSNGDMIPTRVFFSALSDISAEDIPNCSKKIGRNTLNRERQTRVL